MIDLAAALRLVLVTDDELLGDRDLGEVCAAAVRGGVTAVELRLKRASDAALLREATRLVRTLPVPVIVNDRLDIAIAAGAAGVHLGRDDLPPLLVRRAAPPGFIIGASVGLADEIGRGAAADYWGIGPLRATTTKSDAGAALGIAGAARFLAQSGGKPCVVIGGVTPGDVAEARHAGFAGVAVVRGILGSAEIEEAARRYA